MKFMNLIETQRICDPEKMVLGWQISTEVKKTRKRENRLFSDFREKRKMSLSLNVELSDLIVDYWFFVKNDEKKLETQFFFFEKNFFLFLVFVGVFQKWKTRKTRFTLISLLCTSSEGVFFGRFLTLFHFRK